MNNDRGMKKWQPFDSVIASKKMVNDILKEKAKIDKPILSNDEISLIEKKLIDAYYSKSIITIKYYYDGDIKTIKTKIKKIDYTNKIIYLNNLKILFSQIITIY